MHEHLGRGFCQESMNVNDLKIELATIRCYPSPNGLSDRQLSILSRRGSSHRVSSYAMQSFIEEGYTERANTAHLTSPTEFRKRGNILLAHSLSATREILGMAILAQSTNSARQVAGPNEAELQLLAVHPIARRRFDSPQAGHLTRSPPGVFSARYY
jgi:hypothetical protein